MVKAVFRKPLKLSCLQMKLKRMTNGKMGGGITKQLLFCMLRWGFSHFLCEL